VYERIICMSAEVMDFIPAVFAAAVLSCALAWGLGRLTGGALRAGGMAVAAAVYVTLVFANPDFLQHHFVVVAALCGGAVAGAFLDAGRAGRGWTFLAAFFLAGAVVVPYVPQLDAVRGVAPVFFVV